jgi:transcription initiation factor TFIIB
MTLDADNYWESRARYKNHILNTNSNLDDDIYSCSICNYSGTLKKTVSNIVCPECGYCIDEVLENSERRANTKEEVNKRKRTEPVWTKAGPRTLVGNINERVDAMGKKIPSTNISTIKRIAKINSNLINGYELNIRTAKVNLNKLCTNLNIPEYIKNEAWNIYLTANNKKLSIGRGIIGLVGASLYSAIRANDFPRILDEVIKETNTKSKKMHKTLSVVINQVLPEMNIKYKPVTPEILVPRFAYELNLPVTIQNSALKLLKKSSKKGLTRTGKDPKGFAAAAIYITAKQENQRRTQAEISNVAKITEVTLRSRYKEIKKQI